MLHDTQTAARENRGSTGNFHRFGWGDTPKIQASALKIEPGKESLSGLVKKMGPGFYFPVLHGIRAHEEQPFLHDLELSGFECTASGETKPVKFVRLRCDFRELLRRAVVVGNDLAFWGQAGSPSILFEKIPLGM